MLKSISKVFKFRRIKHPVLLVGVILILGVLFLFARAPSNPKISENNNNKSSSNKSASGSQNSGKKNGSNENSKTGSSKTNPSNNKSDTSDSVLASSEQSTTQPEIVPDVLIVKFKPEVYKSFTRVPISSATSSTGNRQIDDILSQYPGTKIYSVFHGNKDSNLIGWFKISVPKIDNQYINKMIPANPDDPNSKPQVIQEPVIKYSLDDLEGSLKTSGSTITIENDYVVNVEQTPNDPYYSSFGSWGQNYYDMWGLRNINASSAWDTTTGSNSIVVADIDTGLDLNHPDITSNLWTNSGETGTTQSGNRCWTGTPANKATNNCDDDNNGYVDDVNGWNFFAGNNDVTDNHGHGTHTAGTIAAVGNNGIGITGLSWSSKIMPLKFIDFDGTDWLGTDSGAAEAVVYATDKGAKVTSNSYGAAGYSQVENDAFAYAHSHNVISAVAAGNDYASDALNYAPASSQDVITVGAIKNTNTIANFSNIGSKIDVVAPGVNVLSLKAADGIMCASNVTVGTHYCYVSGTSMATPHVAGLAALALSVNSNLTPEQFRQLIRKQTTDLGATGYDTTYGYGLIDAAKTVNNASSTPPTVYIASPASKTDESGATSVTVTGLAYGENFSSYKVEIGSGRSPDTWQTITTSNAPVSSTGALATFDPRTIDDGSYTIKLTLTQIGGATYEFRVFDISISRFTAAVTSPYRAVGSDTVVPIIGTAKTNDGSVLTFASYDISYSLGSQNSPDSFHPSFIKTGITLANNGNQAVTDGTLGSFDTSALTNGETYTLRLTITSSQGGEMVSDSIFTVDRQIVSGWPKTTFDWPCISEPYCVNNPVAANIDGGSDKEIIVGDGTNKLYAYKKNGSIVPGWPFSSTLSSERFQQPVAIADIDNDGSPEIIAISSKPNYPSYSVEKIYVLKTDGTAYPGWTPKTFSCHWQDCAISVSTPAIADLNGDGQPEIIFFDAGTPLTPTLLHAYEADGSEISGFPKQLTDPEQNITPKLNDENSAPIVADLNKDGLLEIVISYRNMIYVFGHDGNLLPGWPVIENNEDPQYGDLTSRAVADLDGDGNLEIVAKGSYKFSTENYYSNMYAYNYSGQSLSGWPHATDAQIASVAGANNILPTVDINGDGRDEVLVSTKTKDIDVFSLNGKTTITGNSLAFSINHGLVPVMLSQNGALGILSDSYSASILTWATRYTNLNITPATNNNGGSLWSSQNISVPTSFGYVSYIGGIGPKYNGYFNDYSLLAGDIDNNGLTEIIGYSWDVDFLASYHSPRTLMMWEVPGTPYTAPDNWLSPYHDSMNTQRFTVGDITGPVINITNPKNGDSFSRFDIKNFTFSATATDNAGVKKLEFYVDDQLICADTSAPYECFTSVPVPTTFTSHSITVKAYDNLDNMSSKTINVTSSFSIGKRFAFLVFLENLSMGIPKFWSARKGLVTSRAPRTTR